MHDKIRIELDIKPIVKEEVPVVAATLKWLIHAPIIIADGMSTFSLFPSSDYRQSISSTDRITHMSWQRTGSLLMKAMETIGGKRVENNAG